jgi:hypothetical protein
MSNRISTPQGNVYAPAIQARAVNQYTRTAQGVANGSIDSSELQQLRQQRQSVAGDLNAYKGNDGRVDLHERAAIHQDLNQISGSIAAFRNDSPSNSRLGQKESFEASITGDPHFAVDGSINGQEVSARFDNQDLGTRTQYAGAGFKLETETVPWGSNGAAVVGSATTTTGFGRAQKEVTVNSDGSVLVNGESVTLEAGQQMDLNKTSSLALNEDGSYTVSSRNGKVTNDFKVQENPNGNYIDIHSSVDGVQTVGWLQQQV